jgi:hypothetical protein
MLYWGEQTQTQRLPDPCAVPLSVGISRGQSYVVGMTIEAEGQIDDNICIGVEGRNHEQSIPIMFAPFSGHYFNQLSIRGPTMKAAALKPLDVVPASVTVWIQIFESGGIRFLRQVEDQEPEDAGVLPSESLPRWIDEYFACVYNYASTLKAAVTISAEHASSRFPTWFNDKPTKEKEMNAVWHLVDPDLWQYPELWQ